MKVYRLGRKSYPEYLSGKGAAIRGARWNSVGVEMVYTASSRSLAQSEVSVHLTLATLPDDYMMVSIDIPDDLAIDEVDVKTLPPDWDIFPPTIITQHIGDDFIRTGSSPILKVPSAIVQGDFNFILNPYHPEFKRIKIETVEIFPINKRLFRP